MVISHIEKETANWNVLVLRHFNVSKNDKLVWLVLYMEQRPDTLAGLYIHYVIHWPLPWLLIWTSVINYNALFSCQLWTALRYTFLPASNSVLINVHELSRTKVWDIIWGPLLRKVCLVSQAQCLFISRAWWKGTGVWNQKASAEECVWRQLS